MVADGVRVIMIRSGGVLGGTASAIPAMLGRSGR